MDRDFNMQVSDLINAVQKISDEISALTTEIEFLENEMSKISDKAFDDFKRQFEE